MNKELDLRPPSHLPKRERDWQKFEPLDIPHSTRIPCDFLETIPNRARVINAGCGIDSTLRDLASKYAPDTTDIFKGLSNNDHITPKAITGVGIDINPKAIKWDKDNINIPGIEYKVMNATRTDFPNESVDVVLAQGLTSIFDQYQRRLFYKECYRILKEGGLMMMSDLEINNNTKEREAKYEEGFRKTGEYGTRFVKDHGKTVVTVKQFWAPEIVSSFTNAGFDKASMWVRRELVFSKGIADRIEEWRPQIAVLGAKPFSDKPAIR